MKRAISILLSATITLSLFTGCQQTPEAPIVIGKSHEQMIEKAVSGDNAGQTVSEQIAAEERYSLDAPLTNAQGTLEVHVDAAILSPDTGGFTTAKVASHAFTEAECALYAAALFDGQTTYSGEVLNSKEGYRQQILEWQKQLALEIDEQQKQQLQGSIEKYQKAMAELPDGEGLVEAPVAFRTRPNGDEYMYLISDGSDGRYRSITVTNDSEYNSYTLSYMASDSGFPTMGNTFSTGIKCELERGIAELGDPDPLPELVLTPEQAARMTADFLENMGVSGYAHQCTDTVYGNINGSLQKAYRLQFTRAIGETAFNFVSGDLSGNAGGGADDGKGGYLWGWTNESMTFLVTDRGIASMEWVNPYEVSEVVTEDTALLDFASVAEIFGKMIIVVNAHIQEGLTRRIDINRAELGLMRVLDPATRGGSGIVIPVWDFFGKSTYTFEDGSVAISDDPNEPYITVNAIDGSIIDRTLGD